MAGTVLCAAALSRHVVVEVLLAGCPDHQLELDLGARAKHLQGIFEDNAWVIASPDAWYVFGKQQTLLTMSWTTRRMRPPPLHK